MQVPVQVLSSRSYSFQGRDGKPVSLVELMCILKLGNDAHAGKVNIVGTTPLQPGNYLASLRANDKDGKLSLGLRDFVPASAGYAATK